MSPSVEKFVATAMDARKDYYAALGLLPDADVALIKAAYRVLAKKYHPDSTGGSDEASKQKFLEIKEAYDVLTDAEERRAYDKARDARQKKEDDLSATQKDGGVEIDPDERWDKLSELHPGLDQTYRNLHSISVGLANGFRLSVLEARDSASFKEIATGLEKKFLRKYFSPHVELQNLAKRLLLEGNREQARRLNAEIKSAKHLGLKKRRELIKRFQLEAAGSQAAGTKTASDGQRQQSREQTSSGWERSGPKRRKPESASKSSFGSVASYLAAFCGLTVTLVALAYFYAAHNRQSLPTPVPENIASICYRALNSQQTDWSKLYSATEAVAVTRDKGLSIDDCRKALGLEALAKGDGQPTIQDHAVSDERPVAKTGRKMFYERLLSGQPDQQTSETAAEDIATICSRALNSQKTAWTREETGKDAVEKARGKGLSVNRCLLMMARKSYDEGKIKDAIKIYKAAANNGDDYGKRRFDYLSRIHNFADRAGDATNRELCERTLNLNRNDWLNDASGKDKAEVWRRGLTVAECRLALGMPALPIQDRQTDRLASMSNSDLCKAALNTTRDAWGALTKHASLAENRGLSVNDCRVLLGLRPILECPL